MWRCVCIVVAACGSYGASPWRFSRCWGMFLPPIISSKLCLQHLSSFCRDIVGGWSHGLSPDCGDVKLGSTIKRFNQTKKTISQYFLCLWRGVGGGVNGWSNWTHMPGALWETVSALLLEIDLRLQISESGHISDVTSNVSTPTFKRYKTIMWSSLKPVREF